MQPALPRGQGSPPAESAATFTPRHTHAQRPGSSLDFPEGVELETGFTATISPELRVGGVEETIFLFAGFRTNVGVDVYNLFNTDAITTYNQTYSPNAPNGNPWLTPTGLVQPRFARLQVQFDV